MSSIGSAGSAPATVPPGRETLAAACAARLALSEGTPGSTGGLAAGASAVCLGGSIAGAAPDGIRRSDCGFGASMLPAGGAAAGSLGIVGSGFAVDASAAGALVADGTATGSGCGSGEASL